MEGKTHKFTHCSTNKKPVSLPSEMSTEEKRIKDTFFSDQSLPELDLF